MSIRLTSCFRKSLSLGSSLYCVEKISHFEFICTAGKECYVVVGILQIQFFVAQVIGWDDPSIRFISFCRWSWCLLSGRHQSPSSTEFIQFTPVKLITKYWWILTDIHNYDLDQATVCDINLTRVINDKRAPSVPIRSPVLHCFIYCAFAHCVAIRSWYSPAVRDIVLESLNAAVSSSYSADR